MYRRDWGQQRWASGVALLLACAAQCAVAADDLRARTDSRGFVDVWALRADVAKVEALTVASDAADCSQQGDPDEQRGAGQQAMRQRQERKCIAAWKRGQARYDAARQRFNHAWAPALRNAIQRGDHVAEVIWRQCGTTSVLDRAGLESTCDEAPTRRALAARRLLEIGFDPAFDRSDDMHFDPHLNQRAQVQAVVRQRFAAGDLGGWRHGVHHGGNAPATAAELEEIRNAMVLDTVLMEARRAFTFTIGKQAGTDDLVELRLNRRPTTPEVLTWQARLPYSGRHDWRAGPAAVYLKYDMHRKTLVGGLDDARFLRHVQKTLAEIESNIERWLAEDPRWSVFLLQRLGRHEWVPAGLASSSGRLDAAWRGQWKLQRQFDDLRPVDIQPTRAYLDVQADRSLLRFEADPAGSSSAVQCELRYSGGSSQKPQNGSHGTSATSTVLGYLPSFTHALEPGQPGPVEPFAPMDPRKSYRQVLVQCPQGEWPDNSTARFLFVAGDTMVEVMKKGGSLPLVIRHWQRDSAAYAPPMLTVTPPPTEATARAVVGWFDAAAARAESVERGVQQASTSELIAMLASSRNERLYYSRGAFPENLQILERRAGIVGDICAALRAAPVDPLVRFNLVMVMVHQVRDGLVPEGGKPDVAACFRQSLGDPHPWVRTEAVWGLGFVGTADDAEAVEPLLGDLDFDVRREARRTLTTIRHKTPPGR